MTTIINNNRLMQNKQIVAYSWNELAYFDVSIFPIYNTGGVEHIM